MSKEVKTIEVELLKNGFPNTTVFFLGATGSGKTTLIAKLLKAVERFVIFDSKNDYTPEFFGGDVQVVTTLEHFVDALNRGVYRIIIRMPTNQEMAEILLSNCCENLMAFQQVNNSSEYPPVTVLVDDSNRFASTNYCPAGLANLVTVGRDFRIVKFIGAQWFGTLPTVMRDSFTEIYAWKHTDKNGLNLLENFGFNKDEIKDLPLHTCLHTGKSGVEMIRLAAVSSSKKSTPEAELTERK